MDDMSFLRLRNLTLRCIAASVDLACAHESNSPNASKHHHHTNNVGSVINGEDKEDGLSTTRFEILCKVTDELLNLHEDFAKKPPPQISQVIFSKILDFNKFIVFYM